MTLRRDPVLNFTQKLDFPFQGEAPLSVHWRGKWVPPVAGRYQLQALTSDWAAVKLDGRKIIDSSLDKPADLILSRGSHRLEIDFRKTGGQATVFHFIWKRPGADRWEIVPASAYGTLP